MTDIESLDIEHMEHQEALQYVKRFKVLMEINASINSAMDLEILLRTIIDIAASVMNAEASSLALREASTGELVFHIVSQDSNKNLESLRLPKGQGIAGWVAENGEPVIVPDVSKDKRFYSGVDKQSDFVTRSIVCVPMRRSGENIIGVLQVLNKKEGTFDHQDLLLFSSLANIAAIAIENSQLYHILQQTMDKLKADNTRLNNILAQLKQSEEEVKRMKTQMEAADGSVKGSLSVFIPPNILQMLANDMKTGVVVLTTPTQEGKLYLSQGEVYHAELLQAPALTGNPAVYEMINWNEGTFAFSKDVSVDHKTIEGSCMHLIIEGLRRGDELQVLLEKHPPQSQVKGIDLTQEAEYSQAATEVLSRLQLNQSLEELWKLSTMDRHTFYNAIDELSNHHLLKLTH